MNKSKLSKLTTVALFGAMSFVLMFFSFSVPIISPFAEFDISALPELIGGFILGPTGAIEIIAIKLLLKLAFKGSTSMFTGEIQNFILSIAYVLPAVLYYRRHKTKKGAVIGLITGSLLSVVLSVFTNLYLIFPAFIKLYGLSWDSIIETCGAVNSHIKNIPTFVAFSVIPFNIISRTITSIITMLIYKKISTFIKRNLLTEG